MIKHRERRKVALVNFSEISSIVENGYFGPELNQNYVKFYLMICCSNIFEIL